MSGTDARPWKVIFIDETGAKRVASYRTRRLREKGLATRVARGLDWRSSSLVDPPKKEPAAI